jgi:cation diffusion facilitator family transporter
MPVFGEPGFHVLIKPVKRIKQANLALGLGFGFNVLLAVAKTSLGIFGNSAALLADGINSAVDVMYYLVIWVFLRYSVRPADKEHPYGHSQLESIGAVIVGAFVLVTGITIFFRSLNVLVEVVRGTPGQPLYPAFTLGAALATVAIKLALMFFTRSVGTRTKNVAVSALAEDHKNDVFTALAVVIGLVMSFQGWHWVDPLAGVIVSLVVLWTGIEILRASADELMDTLPGQQLDAQVRSALADEIDIREIEEVRAHRFGPYLVINLTICVDGGLSVREGDGIATRAEERLFETVDYLRSVHVHYHPC